MADAAVQQVMELTGSTAEQARFLLDAAAGDVQAAVSNFYELGPEQASVPRAQRAGGTATNRGLLNPSALLGAAGGANDDDDEDDDDDDEDDGVMPANTRHPQQPTQPSAPSSSSRIRTLNDLRSSQDNDHHGHAHSGGGDDDDGQEFFAGGKSSGVAVHGGTADKKRKPHEVVESLLQKARETGQREQAEGPPPGTTLPANRAVFSGQGHRLGESMDEPSQPMATAGGPATPTTAPVDEPLNHTLYFWRNGFSVDDGPLRQMDDPANVEFLQALNQGRVPPELRARFGQQVNVTVQQRMEENFKPPPKVLKPFSGQGNRLGDTADTPVVSASTITAATTVTAPQISVSESEPVTSLQIRLSDGTKLVARFNHSHTVGDVRNFIGRSRPGDNQRQFVISTTFPTRELSDDTQTLAQANLINAVIVQRFK